MNTAAKEKMDANISRITIVNELSPDKINIAEGEQIQTFFVVLVILKRKDFDAWTITTLSKLISQNMLFVLEYGDDAKLALYHTKLMQTPWLSKDELTMPIKGLNLDTVWENIIIHIGGVKIENGNTLDKQIAIDDKRNKLKMEINRLDKRARKEKQPRKKFELVQEIHQLKKKLEG